jgi:hypothetical protein
MWRSIGAATLLFFSQVAAAAGTNDPIRGISVPGGDGGGRTATTAPTPALAAHATVHFRNDVSDAFQLVEARFSIDGVDLAAIVADAGTGQDFVVFTGPVSSGRHVITSHLTYRGRSRSVFTYLKGYTFNLDSQDELRTPGDSAVSFTVVGKENKGFNIPYEKRLGVALEDNTAPSGVTVPPTWTGPHR